MSEESQVISRWSLVKIGRQLRVASFQKIRDRFAAIAAIAIAKMGLRAMSQMSSMSSMSSMSYTDFATFYVVGVVVVVGMGLSDKYRLIIFANFCNFFTFCTGILCNLGIFEPEVAAVAAAELSVIGFQFSVHTGRCRQCRQCRRCQNGF